MRNLCEPKTDLSTKPVRSFTEVADEFNAMRERYIKELRAKMPDAHPEAEIIPPVSRSWVFKTHNRAIEKLKRLLPEYANYFGGAEDGADVAGTAGPVDHDAVHELRRVVRETRSEWSLPRLGRRIRDMLGQMKLPF